MTKTYSRTSIRKIELPDKLLMPFVHSKQSVRQTAAALQQQGIQVSRTTVGSRMHALRSKLCTSGNKTAKSQRKFTARDQRHISKLVRFKNARSKMQVYKQLRRAGYFVCYQTVRRELARMHNLRFANPVKKPYMTAVHMRARLAWAKDQLRSPTDWTKVFFADETQWKLEGPVRRGKVLYDIRDGKPVATQKGGSRNAVQVWGAFSLTSVPPLAPISLHFNSDEYISLLAARFLRYANKPVPVLLHDRHPAHTSKRTMQWLTLLGIEVITLPPKSPDLNPIENIWSVLDRHVFEGLQTYNTKEALLEAVRAAWQQVTSDHSMRKNLVDSMTRRLKAVVRAKGGPTKY
jgi:transposase/arginine repressor